MISLHSSPSEDLVRFPNSLLKLRTSPQNSAFQNTTASNLPLMKNSSYPRRPMTDFSFSFQNSDDSTKKIRNKRSSERNKTPIGSKHHRVVGRKEADPSSFIPHSRVPRQFSSTLDFQISSLGRGNNNGGRELLSSDGGGSIRRHSRLREPKSLPQEEDKLITGGQRLFPTYSSRQFVSGSFRDNGRFYPAGPHPPGPLPLSPKLPRGIAGSPNSFSRRPSFRGRGREDDIHDGPKFAHPSHRFNDFHPVDNSILGSGNFEIIKGGTFYTNDDPHLNHNPFDHYLDNGFGSFHGGNPHTSNHVDDFFSNFRDFSEFATRRSGSDTPFTNEEGGGYFEPGFASEQIPSLTGSYVHDMMTTESKVNETKLIIPMAAEEKVKSLQMTSMNPKAKQLSKEDRRKKKEKYIEKRKRKDKSETVSTATKRPKNIQDVLRALEDSPSSIGLPKDDLLEEDPLIAVF